MLRFLLFIWFAGFAVAGWAQAPVTVTVSGRVLQESGQQALAGVTIAKRPGRTAVVSGANGDFKIKASPGDTLIFYSIGYKNFRYPVSKAPAQIITIRLRLQNVELQEVEISARPSAEKINRALRNMKKPPEPNPTKAPPAPEPLFEEKETVPVKPNAYNNPATVLYEKFSKEGVERQKMEAIHQQKRDSIARKKEEKYDELFLDRNRPFKNQQPRGR